MKKKLLSAALVGAMVASLAGGATAVMAEEKNRNYMVGISYIYTGECR